MFSPVGVKKVMQENLRKSMKTGLSVEEIATSPNRSPSRGRKVSSDGTESGSELSSLRRGGKIFLTKERAEKAIDMDDDIGRLVKKLAVTISKFRADRDGLLLQAFTTSALNYQDFRLMLKRVYNLDFFDTEFELVCKIFDENKDGLVDGEEFLVCAKVLGSVWRSRLSKKYRQVDKENEKKIKEREDMLRAMAEAKLDTAADFDYSPADEEGILLKIRLAAKNYIKSHPSSMGLDGFDVKYMKPGVFRELLRRTFGIFCSPQELGALIRYFNINKTGDDRNIIDCGEFLIKFSRMGHEQRNQDRLAQLDSSRKASQDVKARQEKLLMEADLKMEIGLDKNYSEGDKENALEKLRAAATKYQKHHPSSLGLDGFNGKYLSPGTFREMLKRTFNILVTNKELGALVDHFDCDGEGKICCKSFLLYFTKVGFLEKGKIFSESLQKQRREIELQEQEEARKLAEKWKKLEIDPNLLNNPTPEDEASAFKKLGEAARFYNRNSALGASLEAFETISMPLAMFRELCKRNLNVKFTLPELAALGSYFDSDGTKTCINCSAFIVKFQSLGYLEKDKAREEQRKKIEEARKLAREREEELLRVKGEDLIAVDFSFSLDDLESANMKFAKASVRYCSTNSTSTQMPSFETAFIKPGHFRDLFGRVLHTELTAKEAGAIASQFLTSDGMIDTAAFQKKFFEVRRINREQIRKQNLEKTKALEEKKRSEEIALEMKKKEDNDQRLQHMKEDELSLLKKIKRVAQSFAIDSAPYIPHFQCFKGLALSPFAFRDNFFRIFLVKLTLPEIGVLMKILDNEMAKKHVIDGKMFLRMLYKISRLEERVLLGHLNEDRITIETLKHIQQRSISNGNNNSPHRSSMLDPSASFLSPKQDASKANSNFNDIESVDNDEQKTMSMISSLFHGTNPWKVNFSRSAFDESSFCTPTKGQSKLEFENSVYSSSSQSSLEEMPSLTDGTRSCNSKFSTPTRLFRRSLDQSPASRRPMTECSKRVKSGNSPSSSLRSSYDFSQLTYTSDMDGFSMTFEGSDFGEGSVYGDKLPLLGHSSPAVTKFLQPSLPKTFSPYGLRRRGQRSPE